MQALGRFFERNRPGFEVTVEAADLPGLPQGFEAALYRIAQEALTNAARHAEAAKVRITLAHEDEALVLTVADDGRGLDPAAPGGRGLLGMRERVAAYGGALTLTPTRPHGLTLSAAFPLAAIEA